MQRFRNLIFAVALLAPSPLWAQAPRYTIDSSRQPAGASINDINNNGDITGTLSGSKGAYLTKNGVVNNFIQLSPGSSGSVGAVNINNAGQVAGVSGTGSMFHGTGSYLYSNGTTSSVNIASPNVDADGLNDQGVIVGAAYDAFNATPSKAFSWQDGVTTYLGSLRTTSGLNSSNATAVNNSGSVVGYSYANDGLLHAFLYQNGTMQQIAPGNTGAFGINDQGQIVGGWTGSARSNAFIYTNGVIQELGTLGTAGSRALDINNHGQVIGDYYGGTGFTTKPFYYQNGTMYDLESLLDSSAGWNLQHVSAINDSGQIVGYGLLNGVQTFFVATPVPVPEPAGIVLGLGGMLTLGVWRVIRRRARSASSGD